MDFFLINKGNDIYLVYRLVANISISLLISFKLYIIDDILIT